MAIKLYTDSMKGVESLIKTMASYCNRNNFTFDETAFDRWTKNKSVEYGQIRVNVENFNYDKVKMWLNVSNKQRQSRSSKQ